MMTVGFLTRWIKALESGNYKKTLGTLHDNEGYCCLGVQADIQGCTWKDGVPYFKDKINSSDYKNGYLGPNLAKGLSLRSQITLSRLNDDSKTFEPVIKFLKRKLKRMKLR